MRIVLSGGGTGGHIYPALAIARACKAVYPNAEFLYIGTSSGMESKIVPKEGIAFTGITITGFRRKLSFDNVKTVARFLRGVHRSKQLLREFKPDVVIGTGGYVCGPVVYAASRLRIPTLIHEQNAIPGLTNVFLSRFASTVAVSFEGGEKHFSKARHAVYTGNPRATDVCNADPDKGLASLGLSRRSRLVVIVGGSRGAKALNEAMIEMIPMLANLPDVQFLFITGEQYYKATLERAQSLGTIPDTLQFKPYVHNMPDILSASKLVVGRSGASSLAEMTALAIPSILIPSPNVTNNHQEANARQLENCKAAEVILERDLTGDMLFQRIASIMNDQSLQAQMAAGARSLGKPDSAHLIIKELELLTKRS